MSEAFTIVTKPEALAEVAALRAFDARQIDDAVNEQLRFEPSVPTRRRKRLGGAEAGFPFDPPLWELRVGEYRVYYDVNEADRRVVVRAIRHKGNRTTGEVLK